MTIGTSEAVRLPFSQQFSPKVTPLAKLLPILRSNAGKPSLTNALVSAFHAEKTDPTGMASNTIYALRSWGILGEKDALSDFGKDLIATQGDESKGHRLLASRYLLTLNGVHLVETLREMKEAGRAIDLRSLAAELETRGVQVSKTSSDLSSALGWLRSAGVVTGQYGVSDDTYRAVCGASIASLNALRGLTPEQIAFLRAMLALNVKEFTSFSEIVRHAEGLYAGEVRFNWKEIPSTVLHTLETTGLIAYQKQSKKGLDTPEGRGGKSGLVKPTAKFGGENLTVASGVVKGKVGGCFRRPSSTVACVAAVRRSARMATRTTGRSAPSVWSAGARLFCNPRVPATIRSSKTRWSLLTRTV